MIGRRLKQYTPDLLKTSIKSTDYELRKSTSSYRMLPDFIIIGSQRCGTTSLYNYLKTHPNVLGAAMKEVHYFTLNYSRGVDWYKSNFPLNLSKYVSNQIRRKAPITGEATPYYIFHPHVPKRVQTVLPDVKLIAILRNPVDRAYSHYHHEVKRGREQLSFQDAIENESTRLDEEIEKLSADENYYSYNHHRFSYLKRGVYIDQLIKWFQLFPKEQILVLKSERLFSETKKTLNQVFDFLDLSKLESRKYNNYNPSNRPKIDPEIRERLATYYKTHNQKLYDFLEKDFRWS